MSAADLPRLTREHTTEEAIEVMNDREQEYVVVVDRQSNADLAVLSRATLVEECVRGWHDPTRCRLDAHVPAHEEEAAYR